MAGKFYFTSLAARPMTLSGHIFKFIVCSMSGGRAAGFYEANDPAEIAILDGAVQAKRGISAISEEEGEKLKKKVSQTPVSVSSRGFRPRSIQIPTLPLAAVESRPGVPSAGLRADGSQNPPEDLPPSPSIGSLLHVRTVTPPQPFSAANAKAEKASGRADRAKIRVARRSVDSGG